MKPSLFKGKIKSALVVAGLVLSGNYYAQLGLKWSEMGPNDIAGRTRSILVDNQDGSGNTLYAAGVSGGIFKSTDAAATWMPVNDQAPSLIVGCMAQALNGDIFLGTGETFGYGGNGDGYSGFLGTGLYKLVGTTMTQLKDSSFFGNVNEVATDPTNSSKIYIAAQKGFFVTSDGGTTFTQITTSTATPVSAMDVKVSNDGLMVYFSVGSKTGTTSRVYRGAGTSFTDVTPSASNSNAVPQAFTNSGRIELATAASDANVVYLSVAKNNGRLSALYVSNNQGLTWNIITLGSDQRDPYWLSGNTVGFGDYAHTISVDPSNPYVLYIASLEFFRWSQISSNTLGQGNWDPNYTLFSFMHDIKCHNASKTMYVASDNGILKSATTTYSFSFLPYLNFTGGYASFLNYNKGFNVSQFNSVAYQNMPKNIGTGGTAVPAAGVAGGNSGNGIVYLPGNLNTLQTSLNYQSGNYIYQSDFSKILPNALFVSGSAGSVMRSNDISITNPSTFYDQQYKKAIGSNGPSNLNTPMRLFENFGNMPATDYQVFYDQVIKISYSTLSASTTTFAASNQRPQASGKFDMIYVNATSTKKLNQPFTKSVTVTNSNTTTATFTFAPVRANATAKYTTVIASFTSTKMTPTVAAQSSTVTVAYTGTVVSGYTVAGSPSTVNITPNSSLTDNISVTFTANPLDSSVITLITNFKYSQDLAIQPIYTGTAITSYTVTGEADVSSATNNRVVLKPSLQDSVYYKFLAPPGYDSCKVTTNIHMRYDVGSYIVITNMDISGQTFKDSVQLSTALYTTSNPPYIRVPLKKSGRLAVGVKGGVYAVKRPLNFGASPDWVQIAGAKSRTDSPGGVATSTDAVVAVVGTTQRLEWAPSGKEIYFSTNNGPDYYVYRISHIDFLGDSVDYTGFFSTDIDSTSAIYRKGVPQRTTCLGKFQYPITSISVLGNSSGIMLTLGAYSNSVGTVYTSNGDVRTLNMNNTDATNFTVKTGSGLPKIPVYSSLFEMTNNNRALVGTEGGIYTTPDITLASPVWTKETGPAGNQLPNVPVYQIRQQTMPSWECYNHGIIYVATHGRGIWSTDNYLTPYAIGINEQEKETLTANSAIKLYPNPASDNAYVWFNNNNDGTSYKVSVTDISGRTVLQTNLDKLQSGEQTVQLNTANLYTGVYFVMVSGSNNFKSTSKLVIAK